MVSNVQVEIYRSLPQIQAAIVIVDETTRFHIKISPSRLLTLTSISSGLHELITDRQFLDQGPLNKQRLTET